MSGKHIQYFVLLLFSVASIHAGELKLQFIKNEKYKNNLDIFNKLKSSNSTKNQLSKSKNRQEIGRTWDDSDDNFARKIAYSEHRTYQGLHFVFFKTDISGQHYVTYNFWDESYQFFYGNQPVTTLFNSSNGKIIDGKSGEVIGVLNCLNGSYLFQDFMQAGYSFILSKFSSGMISSIDRIRDTVILTSLHQPIDSTIRDTLYYSTDYLNSWNFSLLPKTKIKNYQINPQIHPVNSGEISFINYDSLLVKWTTYDFGNTWTSEAIYDESIGNPDGSVYMIGNFSQYNYMYSHDGIFHVVANGYGINSDSSGFIFPIIYWNNLDRQWIELTWPEIGRPTDSTIIATLSNNYPGNGIGNAYPHIAEDSSRGLIGVIWQQWEEDGSGGINTRVPVGGTEEIFMTDIYGTFSPNQGNLWSFPQKIAGTLNESDIYPNITREFEVNYFDSLLFDISFLVDTNPGISMLNQSDSSECIWYYRRTGFWIGCTIPYIDNENEIKNSFLLYQNHPNPFNPATYIKYELFASANVTLSIFDMLGQKIKTLINHKQNKGMHEIMWDSTDEWNNPVASGVYLYQIQAGNFKKTKKMLLIR